MNIIKIFFYIFVKRNLYILRNFFTNKHTKKNNDASYINYLSDLKHKGYVVIKNFMSKDECEIIISQIESFLKDNKELTYRDKNNSDERIHGAENISEKINNFNKNKLSITLGEYYFNGDLENLMTMANKTIFTESNEGSGGGWHRDGLNFQYKAILYLVDVDENNGPFQLIYKSQRLFNILKTCLKYNLDPFNTRISNEVVEKIIRSKKNLLKTIAGFAGDLILVDTSLIHRGCPLNKAKRYALTNYYYPKNIIYKYKKSFNPFVKNKFY